MLTSIIDTSNLKFTDALVCMAIAFGLGALVAVVYYFFGERKSKGFLTTLILLPVLVQTVMLIMFKVGSLAVGIATFGIFTLVKFRSLPGSAMDIGCIFAEMAIGVLLGTGYALLALVVTAAACAIYIVMRFVPIKTYDPKIKKLKVVIPESSDYTEMFNDFFDKYAKSHVLEKVKSSDLGSTFELTYIVQLKKSEYEKMFIDEIRIRNGNLPVTVSIYRQNEEKTL